MTAEEFDPQVAPQPDGDPPLSCARQYRWPENPWTPKMIDWLLKMWTENVLSARQMGKLMGLSRNAVLGKANRLQLPSHKDKNKRHKPFKPAKVRHVRKPVVIRQPPPRPVPIASEFLAITFEQLQPNDCRFPRGDRHPFTYCGQPQREGSSYCPACHAIVYYQASPYRRMNFV